MNGWFYYECDDEIWTMVNIFQILICISNKHQNEWIKKNGEKNLASFNQILCFWNSTHSIFHREFNKFTPKMAKVLIDSVKYKCRIRILLKLLLDREYRCSPFYSRGDCIFNRTRFSSRWFDELSLQYGESISKANSTSDE